jgi:hypothetical protein
VSVVTTLVQRAVEHGFFFVRVGNGVVLLVIVVVEAFVGVGGGVSLDGLYVWSHLAVDLV